MTVLIRSVVFNALFYAQLIIWMIVCSPVLALSARATLSVAKGWARASIWLLHVVCNTRVEFRGLENLPRDAQPLLIASKHQSMFETFALILFFDAPLYILKRELLFIPLFGWYLRKLRMIGVDRSAGGKALLAMTRRAREEVRGGRQLIIFPEGTRRPVHALPDYKSGIAQIYVDCAVPCVPVALNSGVFWPRRTLRRYPGTLVVEFLEAIPPGLQRRAFIAEIGARIEAATDRIVAEALQDDHLRAAVARRD